MRIRYIKPNIDFKTSVNNSKLHNYTQIPAVQSFDTVSFSGKCKKNNCYTDIRQIPELTCACCGRKTINTSEVDKLIAEKLLFSSSESLRILEKANVLNFSNKKSGPKYMGYLLCKMLSNIYPDRSFSDIFKDKDIKNILKDLDEDTKKSVLDIEKMSKKIYHNSGYMVDVLKPYEKYMHPVEKEVFGILETYSICNPEKTFSEIISNPKLQDVNLKILLLKQDKVFKDVWEIAKILPEYEQSVIRQSIEKAKNIFDSPTSQVSAKRTAVIDMFKQVCIDLPRSREADMIYEKIHELPSSTNDASSFIVKHKDKDSIQIADLLIRSSIKTEEHVVPRHRLNDNGEDVKSNIIMLCKKCNTERGIMPYTEFEKIHPDMPENTQKFIDIIIDNINNGKLIGYDSYPLEIAQTLKKERHTNNSISIRRLNLVEAVKNRGKK